MPHNAAELVGSPQMQKLLEELVKEADLVLLDSPALLAVADAAVLAPIVDGVVLVAARGQTNERQVQKAMQQLDKVGAEPFGVVFNMAEAGDEV